MAESIVRQMMLLNPEDPDIINIAVLTQEPLHVIKEIVFEHFSEIPADVGCKALRNACVYGAQPGVIAFLVGECPESVKFCDNHFDGSLPVHLAMQYRERTGVTEEDILVLLDAYPESILIPPQHQCYYYNSTKFPFLTCMWLPGYSRAFMKTLCSRSLAISEPSFPGTLTLEEQFCSGVITGSGENEQCWPGKVPVQNRNGVDDDCMAAIRILLGRLKKVIVKCDVWHENAFVEFLLSVLVDGNTSSEELRLYVPLEFLSPSGRFGHFLGTVEATNFDQCKTRKLYLSGSLGAVFPFLVCVYRMPLLRELTLDLYDRFQPVPVPTFQPVVHLLGRLDRLECLKLHAKRETIQAIIPVFAALAGNPSLRWFILSIDGAKDSNNVWRDDIKPQIEVCEECLVSILRANASLRASIQSTDALQPPPGYIDRRYQDFGKYGRRRQCLSTLNGCGRARARAEGMTLLEFVDLLDQVNENKDVKRDKEVGFPNHVLGIQFALLRENVDLWSAATLGNPNGRVPVALG